MFKRKLSLLTMSCALFGSLCLSAQQPPDKPKADNTEVNKRDRNKNEPTADQAKDNRSDREIMQKIRQAVVGDKTLSTYAHNVKIISQRGQVTLKGPVRSETEKMNIEAKAREVAGPNNVTNELTIKGDKTASRERRPS